MQNMQNMHRHDGLFDTPLDPFEYLFKNISFCNLLPHLQERYVVRSAMLR